MAVAQLEGLATSANDCSRVTCSQSLLMGIVHLNLIQSRYECRGSVKRFDKSGQISYVATTSACFVGQNLGSSEGNDFSQLSYQNGSEH